ncbi:NAD(P)/FAD-dependent oxidoreductase [uncultured Jatrophihabitans sp.]|uniref:NAD(P)/FAD-dependent oxidoreductase n=1 Tax=uncultured Jatrophihabitans sp. TaxID=1610747 RepID=UPI0035CB4F37
MTAARDDADEPLDLLVVGGGVMGLFTAYYAAVGGARVAVLERGEIGDPATASYGRTRSYRKDYLDPLYVRLADEAVTLWTRFEQRTGVRALVRCGCMNIAKASVTADLADTYAERSAEMLAAVGMPLTTLRADEITGRYPYLDADVAHLDPAAGLVDLRAVADALTGALAECKVDVYEHAEPDAVRRGDDGLLHVDSSAGELVARKLVITAGHGTNDVLALVPGADLQVPLTRDRPSEAKYFVPPANARAQFGSDAMPVIAYLDTGVYVHPIVDGVIDKVKVGYYNPPDIPRDRSGVRDIADFVAQCMPGLADATYEDVHDVDQCDYDLVADDDFVLGAVPGVADVFVGVGWRGTGYKFAPWIGRVLHELALQNGSVYDLRRFDPARFSVLAPSPDIAHPATSFTAPEEDAS